MAGAHRFVRYWLPVVLWAAVIFSASTDALSVRQTSRFIGPLLRWLFPAISDEGVWRVQLVVRKTAHVTEYAILSALLWRALRRAERHDPRTWRRAPAGWAFLAASLYAVTDEWHQSFVPSRGSHWGDVLLDAVGALLGV